MGSKKRYGANSDIVNIVTVIPKLQKHNICTLLLLFLCRCMCVSCKLNLPDHFCVVDKNEYLFWERLYVCAPLGAGAHAHVPSHTQPGPSGHSTDGGGTDPHRPAHRTDPAPAQGCVWWRPRWLREEDPRVSLTSCHSFFISHAHALCVLFGSKMCCKTYVLMNSQFNFRIIKTLFLKYNFNNSSLSKSCRPNTWYSV